MKEIYLAGGCFWGIQKYFDKFEGIAETEVGYANGSTETATYETVCMGSGHAEALKIVFDESIISVTEIIEKFFKVINPIDSGGQGPDRGIQYRTGIYYVDETMVPEIRACYDRFEAEEIALTGRHFVTEVLPLKNYIPAEEFHQKYLDKNPGGYCHIPRELLY